MPKTRPDSAPDFAALARSVRAFEPAPRALAGQVPTIALTPVADGRTGAYESNVAGTWKMTQRVYDLLSKNLTLPDGTPVRIVTAPEIVYGARSAALAQAYYTRQGVGANIWLSRSWAYSDELMGAAMGLGSTEWPQAAYGLNQTDRPGAVWLKAFTAAMDEKRRPIFCIYSPDLEDENEELTPYVAERLPASAAPRPPCWRCAARTTSPWAASPWASSAPTSDATRCSTTSGWGPSPTTWSASRAAWSAGSTTTTSSTRPWPS